MIDFIQPAEHSVYQALLYHMIINTRSGSKKLHWKVGRKELRCWRCWRYGTTKLAEKFCVKDLNVLIKVHPYRQSECSTNEQDPHPRLTSSSETLINSDKYDFKRNSVVSFFKC